MSEADFPKDEETVPVSERACTRLIGVLGALGVDPEVKVNPVDAAAFILEGMLEALQRLNSTTDSGEPDQPECVLTWSEDEPTNDELDDLDTETHESGCAIWDNQEEVDGACTCGLEDE